MKRVNVGALYGLYCGMLTAGMAGSVDAQSLAAAGGMMPASVQEAPVQRINVAFENTKLEDAIWTIAKRSGARILFASNLLPAKTVTYKADGVALRTALAAVLDGTDIRVTRSGAGAWELVRGAEGTRVQGQGVIVGRVTDPKTSRGIAGATVAIGSPKAEVTTADDGGYRLTGLSAGAYLVSVRRVGYAKQTRTITVGEGATVTADFTLDASANVLDQVVVTGTVVQTELRAVPNAITVITAQQIQDRGITRIDQLFRGDVPGLFAQNQGSATNFDEVRMYSRGVTAFGTGGLSAGTDEGTNPIKTYVDGVELANSVYLSQIDPRSIERIEILTGPQASTIYGSNALNGVMQIFTKRGTSSRPRLSLNLLSGWIQNNFSSALTSQYDMNAQVDGVEGRVSYNLGGTWFYQGPWTPGRTTTNLNVFGGLRFEIPSAAGKVTSDVSFRRGVAQNLVRGEAQQVIADLYNTGWYYREGNGSVAAAPETNRLTTQTANLEVGYAPVPRWRTTARIGIDANDSDLRVTEARYAGPTDTLLQYSQNHGDRRSLSANTSLDLPVGPAVNTSVVAGIDGWQSLDTYVVVQPSRLTGNLTGFTAVTRRRSHNTGAFVQSQVGIFDQLFLTYGARFEWNPEFGADVQPNVAPRMGVAWSREIGNVSGKLSASYGRSTRPPGAGVKDGLTLARYADWAYNYYGPYFGNFMWLLPNPDLRPEHQRGAEGNLDLYIGSRMSLTVTRYNQTVDDLIAEPIADSTLSLEPMPYFCFYGNSRDETGRCYQPQYQHINIGTIRNQGWLLSGSVNLGPFTTTGKYSWTKSRTIGLNPRYLERYSTGGYPQFQKGASFGFIPEHTWAWGLAYAHGGTAIRLNVNGVGQLYSRYNAYSINHFDTSIRLQQDRLNVQTWSRVVPNHGYAMADMNASHRIAAKVETTVSITNLTDFYQNDASPWYPTMGRQTRVGLRIQY